MELARSIVSRLRRYVGDRRNSKRQKVRLEFSLSLTSSAKSIYGTRQIKTLSGHTLDLSPNGMAIVVPSIRLGEQHLVGDHRSLNVKLELPSGPVEMQVTPIRYQALEESDGQPGYLMGVRITEMPEEDRVKFTAYVAALLDQRAKGHRPA
jgi:c-di-GMP-binding flagellar brake protein YcgR